MKKLILCLMALAAVLVAQGRTYVLAVGVGNSQIAGEAVFGSECAIDFKNLMAQHTKDVTVMTSSKATKTAILAKLRQLAGAATENDRIYFYIYCHGAAGCLAVYDDYIDYAEIVDILNKSKSPMCLCFIDACHSGSSQNSVGDALAARGKNNVAFMTGCRPDEYSRSANTIGKGFFTKALIKGLRGKSDANSDKRITLLELYKYVYNDVVKRNSAMTAADTPQHPQLIAPTNIQEAAVVVWK